MNKETTKDKLIKAKKKEEKDPRDKLEKFDLRGVQTLLRTISRNHYNLLKMVDNKSRIVLTVNSILISLMMGVSYIIPDTNQETIEILAKILVNCCMLSMVFALFSMLPHRYIGKKFRESGYKGSLYASNFTRYTLEEFRAEFDRILSSGQSIYHEMIDDLYFLGKAIDIKQRLLITSVVIFLIGLIGCIFYSLLFDIAF